MGDGELVKRGKEVEMDGGDEVVFEVGMGEGVGLWEEEGFEHGQEGIGGRGGVVWEVRGSLRIEVLLDELGMNDLMEVQ
nr:hypothetical protein [Neisseria sicca]